MAPRETENNAYAKFWGDKQRALWYVMVFSGVVNSRRFTNRNKKRNVRRFINLQSGEGLTSHNKNNHDNLSGDKVN